MNISRVDSEKRVVLPNGRPGDVYEVQQQDDDRLVLVRVAVPEPARRMDRKTCLDAIKDAPLRRIASWEQLREMTREP